MVTHEPEAASLPLPEAAELTDRENLGGRPASPPALGRAPEASTGPKRRPCQELLGVQEAAEAERCSGPPSKRWREAASIAPWQSPGEAAAPGADSCQQTRDTIQAAEQSCSRQQAGPSSAIPGAVQPGSCKEPGPGNAKQAEQAAKQADAAAADPGTPPDLHGQQPVGWPEWCDKVPTLWVPEDGQVDAFCYLPGHPLLALACEGQAALLAKVLQMGADPNAVDSRGLTALHLACRHARLACARCLLDGGADTRVRSAAGNTAADYATAGAHKDVLDMLRQHEEVQAALAAQDQRCHEAGAVHV